MADIGQEATSPFQQQQGEINNGFAELAERIRATSKEQVETWRLLPYLALRAEGITGYQDTAYQMYQYGLLRVGGDRTIGLFGVFIDCENGSVQSVWGPSDLGRRATDIQVVEAWLPDGDAFDAQRQLEKYQTRANRPFDSEEHEEAVTAWQDDLIKQHRLTPVFSRVSE